MQIKQTKDHELISQLNEEVQNIHATMYPDHFKEYEHDAVSDFFKIVMSNSDFEFYIIEENNIALGYVWIEIKEYKENAFRNSYKSIYVHQLNILETHRNKGLGKKIMNKVNEIAKLHNIMKIELNYWVDNETAKNFYEKNGYIKYKEYVYKDL